MFACSCPIFGTTFRSRSVSVPEHTLTTCAGSSSCCWWCKGRRTAASASERKGDATGKPHGKRPHGRPRARWKGDVKMYRACACVCVERTGHSSVAGSGERCNEHSGSVKSDYQLLNMGSAPARLSFRYLPSHTNHVLQPPSYKARSEHHVYYNVLCIT
jgi:hypothetical protein